MSEKIEGTLVLDGLLEGQIPDLPEAEDRLRQWVAFANSLGLPFSLELDANRFNVLGESRAVAADHLGARPSTRIADLLRELLKVFPPAERGRVFSTLRSIAYQPGFEIQSLYLLASDGTVDVREQSVATDTKPAPRPLTRREKLRLAAFGLGGAVILFAISAIFVNYRALFSHLAAAVRPFDPEKLEVDAPAFLKYLTVEKRALAERGTILVLTLQRTKDFPLQDAEIERALARPGLPLAERMALDALARGYVRFELFDKDGAFLGSAQERIAGLRDKETIEIPLPLPRQQTPTRLAITY